MIILKNKKGFTLIELLVVMLILGFIGSIAVGIVASALRGANKSAVITNIRQNGNYAISQMTKMIAYAQEFEGVCKGTDDCTNPLNFSTSCSNPAQVYKYLKIKNSDGGETIFSCNLAADSPANTIASVSANLNLSSGTPLTDTTDMKITTCNFYCASFSTTVSPTINITFTLTSNGTLAENISQISFETSVKPRNNPSGP